MDSNSVAKTVGGNVGTDGTPEIVIPGDHYSRDAAAHDPSAGRFGVSGGGYRGSGGERGGASPAMKKSARPAANNKPDCGSGEAPSSNPAVGDPVIVATGEGIETETDFIGGGFYGLDMVRTYRSFGNRGSFGGHWYSSYDWIQLQMSGCDKDVDYPGVCVPHTAMATFPDGSSYTYAHKTGYPAFNYTSPAAAAGIMHFIPEDHQIMLIIDNTLYTYSSGSGWLQRVAATSGTSLTFTYNNNFLSKVTNAVGQTLEFTWTNGHITQVQDPAGNDWSYGYNSASMLTSVSSPGSTNTRQYYYEDSADGTRLTGIGINGTRYNTVSYDSSGRVHTSTLTGGEEMNSFTYNANSTAVTNAAGETTTYNFVSAQGGSKLSSTSRAATFTCAAATANTSYDSNGWPAYSLDWNGNRTNYNYDSAGRLQQKTLAVGTASALTQKDTWATGGKLSTTTYYDANNTALYKIDYAYYTSGPSLGLVSTETITDLATQTARQFSYTYTYQNNVLASATTTQTLPSGSASTTVNYDALGNISSTVNALGQQVSWSNYNGLGRPGQMTDANGVITTYTYNTAGAPASKRSAISSRRSYRAPASGGRAGR